MPRGVKGSGQQYSTATSAAAAAPEGNTLSEKMRAAHGSPRAKLKRFEKFLAGMDSGSIDEAIEEHRREIARLGRLRQLLGADDDAPATAGGCAPQFGDVSRAARRTAARAAAASLGPHAAMGRKLLAYFRELRDYATIGQLTNDLNEDQAALEVFLEDSPKFENGTNGWALSLEP